MHLHLEPIGGVAGDMFVAALLDARPDLEEAMLDSLGRLGLPTGLRIAVRRYGDDVLTGTRFEVTGADERSAAATDGHRHGTSFAAIRRLIDATDIAAATKARSLAIFTLLAEAEAHVHGCAVDDVSFHEVGAWDSIVDIVAAADLIERIGAGSWSVAPLPLGEGRVRGAHGELPVPAPATLKLIEGLPVCHDGRPGERVTPTGAAIVRHLAPQAGLPTGPARVAGAGYGFGTRRLDGISNVLRVILLADDAATGGRERIASLEFEVDDQTAEDLAVGIDRLRVEPGVLDVIQAPVFAKKGRMACHVRVLARLEAAEAIIGRCFDETTTLGVRHTVVERAVLPRHVVDQEDVPVKLVRRPGGVTAKADIDAVVDDPAGSAGRSRTRHTAEQKGLRAHAAVEANVDWPDKDSVDD